MLRLRRINDKILSTGKFIPNKMATLSNQTIEIQSKCFNTRPVGPHPRCGLVNLWIKKERTDLAQKRSRDPVVQVLQYSSLADCISFFHSRLASDAVNWLWFSINVSGKKETGCTYPSIWGPCQEVGEKVGQIYSNTYEALSLIMVPRPDFYLRSLGR